MHLDHTNIAPTSKTFKLHPAIIYSIIREQAGDPVKALAELVMNSIDAGAKNVKITLDAERFVVEDDGIGFTDLEYIEKFFGTFGTPHRAGDAIYGKFRIGRGQCFSIAKTEWRSGKFGMIVDLGNHAKTDVHGYQLLTFDEEVKGCRIEGEFYKTLNVHEEIQNPKLFNQLIADSLEKHKTGSNFDFEVFDQTDFFSRLVRSIALVDVNVELNGKRLSIETMNTPYASTDEADFILHKKNSANYDVYLNKGIFVDMSLEYAPLIINFKKSPNVNLARNQINADCPVYKKVMQFKYQLAFNALLNKEKWAASLINTVKSLIRHYANWEDQGYKEGNEAHNTVGQFITKDNISSLVNLIQVEIYKAGRISKVGLYDLLISVQANPDEYVMNNNRQNGLLRSNSKSTCTNFLLSKEIENTLIMDDGGFLEIKYFDNKLISNRDCHNLLRMLKRITGIDFKIQLNPHSIFSFEEDLTPYQVAAKKRKVEVGQVEQDLSHSKKALNHLIDNQLVVPILSKALLQRLDSTEAQMSEYTTRLKNFLIDAFAKSGINIDEKVDWLLKSPEPIWVLFVAKSKIFSFSYEGFNYLILHEKCLSDSQIISTLLTRLFYPVGLGVDQTIFSHYITEEKAQKVYESIYELGEVHEQIHNCLQDISNHVEFSRFLEDGVNLFVKCWLNGRRKMSSTDIKLTNQVLDFIDLMPSEFQDRIQNFEQAKKMCVPIPKRWNERY